MKKQRLTRFVMSGLAIAATITSLTASTFAFVVIGKNVYVTDFNFNIEGYEGLAISLDGENYSQDISKDALLEHIKKTAGYDFNLKTLTGVTPKQHLDNSGNYILTYDENGKMLFEKDFVDISVTNREHEFVTAESNRDYISFDLYFKVLNSTGLASNYSLTWGKGAKLTSTPTEVQFETSFKTWSLNEQTGYYESKLYKQGDSIFQNVSNAMRIAVVNDDVSIDNRANIFEVTDQYDMGSAAINGAVDEKHDPYNSIMLNYYNSFFPLNPFTTVNTNKKYIETNVPYEKKMVDENGDPIYTIVYKYDENGNPVYVQDKDSDGNLMWEIDYIIARDEYGNMLLDENNHSYLVPRKDADGNVCYKQAVDEDGYPLYIDGKPVYIPVYKQQRDSNGKLLYDKYGNPIYERETIQGPQKTETAYRNEERLLEGIQGATPGQAFNTKNSFGSTVSGQFSGESLGSFNTNGIYHATVYIWLEGWDADYLVGTSAEGSNVICSLEFSLGNN